MARSAWRRARSEAAVAAESGAPIAVERNSCASAPSGTLEASHALQAERMADDADLLAVALELDLVDADDFAR